MERTDIGSDASDGPHATGVGLDHWGDQFPMTDWSGILSRSDSEEATKALSRLCENYWYPLYAFLRRKGHSAHDAQDLTQGFLAQIISKNSLSQADPDRGRFRSFLLTALKHYVNDVRKRNQAQKRGGGAIPVSIEQELAEERYQNEPGEDLNPETLYDRNWALTLLQNTMQLLKDDYTSRGKAALFEVMSDFLLWNARERSYKEAAEEIGMSEGALKVNVVRLRKRFGKRLRAQIEQIVSDPNEVQGEMDYLMQVFS